MRKIEQAMAESAGRTELAGHRHSAEPDMDVPAVTIGGVRYTRVDGVRHPTHDGGFGFRREIVVPSIGRAWGTAGWPGSGSGELAAGVVEDGWLPRAARAMAHACSKARRGKRKRARASLAACRIRVPVFEGWRIWLERLPLPITRTLRTP